jgi:hypothetical protein
MQFDDARFSVFLIRDHPRKIRGKSFLNFPAPCDDSRFRSRAIPAIPAFAAISWFTLIL